MTSPADRRPGPSEADLVDAIARLFRRQWPVRALALEVRSHGRCRTDASMLVGGPHGAPRLLVGIEAKLADRARAVAQAAMNRYCVDASFVAMPAGRVTDVLLADAARHGVGVLAVSARRLDVALPALTGSPDPALRDRVLTQLDAVRPRGRGPVAGLVAAPDCPARLRQGAA